MKSAVLELIEKWYKSGKFQPSLDKIEVSINPENPDCVDIIIKTTPSKLLAMGYSLGEIEEMRQKGGES